MLVIVRNETLVRKWIIFDENDFGEELKQTHEMKEVDGKR